MDAADGLKLEESLSPGGRDSLPKSAHRRLSVSEVQNIARKASQMLTNARLKHKYLQQVEASRQTKLQKQTKMEKCAPKCSHDQAEHLSRVQILHRVRTHFAQVAEMARSTKTISRPDNDSSLQSLHRHKQTIPHPTQLKKRYFLSVFSRNCSHCIHHPYFKRIAGYTIAVDMIIMAFANNNSSAFEWLSWLEFCCTLLCLTEIILYFFAMRLHKKRWAFLNVSKSRLAYAGIVIASTFTHLIIGTTKTPLRVIHGLKTYRCFTIFRSTQRIIDSVAQAMSLLANVGVLAFFFLLLFSIVGLESLAPAYEKACMLVDIELSMDERLSYPREEQIITTSASDQICGLLDKPASAQFKSFDNAFSSFLLVFQVMSQDDWVDKIMIPTMQSTSAVASLFFIMIIVTLVFLVINLFVAVISTSFMSFHTSDTAHHDSIKSGSISSVPSLFDLRKMDKVKEEQHVMLVYGTTIAVENAARRGTVLDNDLDTLEATPVRPTEDSPRLKSAANTSEVLSGKSSRDLLPIATAVKLMENHMIHETPTDSAEDKFLTDLKNAPGRLGRLRRYVMSNHFSDMMVLCISLNTIVLMVEYPSMPVKAQYAVNFIEATFTFVFTFELMLRLYAYQSIRNYFSAKDRCFDAFVVVVSLVYTIFNPPHVRAVGEHKSSLGWLDNVSILRTLRIGRLMWKWNGTRKLIEAILKSGKSMKHLIIFLMHFLIVHTLLAMQLFQDIHYEEAEPTASTFDEFFVAFITMFQVFSGDRWAEVMQSILITLPFGGQVFVAAFFMVFFFFGQFVILNLFIAVILENFAISEEEAYQLQLERVLAQPKELLMLEKFDEVGVRAFYQNRDMMNLENVQDIKARRFLGVSERGLDTTHSGAAHEITSLDVAKHWIGVLLQTTGFKLFIILTIFASCVALALDDPIVDHHDPIETQHHEDMGKVLDGVNYFAMTVFITEFFLKIFAHGFGLPILGEKWFKIAKYTKLNRIRRRRKLAKYYIEDPWNLLDFFLLLVSILDFTVTQKYPNLSFAKVLRVGRVLRPLRLFNQDGDMKLIMTSFAASLPAVADVLVFCLGVFVIFGIAGRTLYSEKMYQCNDTSVKNRTMCQGFYIAYPIPESPVGILATRAWVPYRATFDNLMTSMMVLMEISSLKWIYTAHFAMSIVGQDEQPETNASIANALYFILLVFLGNFFLIRLFVGVLVEQFQRHNGTQILTSSQKCWVELERHMLLLKPKHSPPQPSNKYRNMAYKFVKSMKFEHGMTALVLLNMIFLLVNGKNLDESTKHTLTSIDTFFLTIYSIESLLKIIAYGQHCARDSWFLFELAILIGSYISNVSDEVPTNGIGKPVTQIGRIFRVMRVMKFAKLSKGVRTVFRTFRASLGSIGNVVLLLVLLLYIFSILGRQLFGTTKLGEYLNDDMNFRTFSSSFLLLFGIMAGGDWNFVMTDCMISTGFCSTLVDDIGNTITDCGNFHAAWIFFFVFIVSIVYIFLNLFIAVILENFRSCYVKDISPVTLEDFEGYQDIFEKYDHHHKGTIPLHQLAAFLQELPLNLRVCSTGNRIAYLHLRYEIENILMTNKSIPFFNGLLRSICIHHMGIRALSYEQQRDRVKQIFLIKERVANMLVTAMITGAVQRKRIRDKKRSMSCTAQARGVSKSSNYLYEPHPNLMAQTPTSSLASSPAKKTSFVSKRVSMVQEEMENMTSTSHDHQAEAENYSCLQPPPEIASVGNTVANADNDESPESKSHAKKGHKKHKHRRKDKSSHHNHDSIELPMPSTPCTNEADVPLDVPTDQVHKNVDDWHGIPRRLPKLGDAPKIVPL